MVTAEQMKDYVWLEPRVVAEVRFTQWTEGGVLRHPEFVTIRDDKAPEDVRREDLSSQGGPSVRRTT